MTERRLKIEQRILKQVLRALMLLSLALVQVSLAPTIWRFRADLVLIAVVGWTLLRGLVPGVRWALYGGVSLDLLGMLPVGTHLLALLVCVIMIAAITEPLDREQPLLGVASMLVAAFAYGCILALVLTASGVPVPWNRYVLVEIIPLALINTIISVPLFAMLRRLHQRGRPSMVA